MLVPAEPVRKKYKDWIVVITISALLKYWRGWTWFAALGCIFTIFVIVEVITTLMGHVLARIMYERVWPVRVRELKHTEHQYQYILTVDKGKEVYTYVYGKPLDEVDVKCWKFNSSYLIEVTKKRRVREK